MTFYEVVRTEKVTLLKRKTLILGNGPCAHHIAKDLFSAGLEIVIATRDKTCPLDFPVEQGKIKILKETRLLSCSGSIGNFRIIAVQGDNKITINAADIIIAEEDQRQSNFSLYGLTPTSKVIGLSHLMELVNNSSNDKTILSEAKKIVCLTGLKQESNPVITGEIMRTCLKLQSEGSIQTYILTHNLKVAANGLEALYRETKNAGTVYIKVTDNRPEIHSENGGGVQIEFTDEITLKKFRLTPDLTVVDETIVPSDYLSDFAEIFKIDTDPDGFVQADNVHRYSVFTNRKGILAAGPSRSVQSRVEQIMDAENASLIPVKLAAGAAAITADKAEIHPGHCVRCLTCYRRCPYHAITLNARVVVEPDACEGCGICAAQCPRGAVHIINVETAAISDQIKPGAYPQTEKTFIPSIVAFCCLRSAAQAYELALCMGYKLPPGLQVIKVPCAGAISYDHIFTTLKNNADGVMVLTCHNGNCHSERGNIYARQTVTQLTDMFSKIGFESERLSIQTLASSMGTEFARMVNSFEESIAALGLSRLMKNQ